MQAGPRAHRALLVTSIVLASCSGAPEFKVRSASQASMEPQVFGFEDPHQGGRASELRLVEMSFGRLVEVLALDSSGQRVPLTDTFVVEPGLDSIPGVLILEASPVTGQDTVVVLRDVDDETPGGGRDQLAAILREASDDLTPVARADVGALGVFTLVPRDAAVVLRFDDLLDASTIDATTVQLRTGYPPAAPLEVRVLPDPHHGGLADLDGQPGEEPYTTRVILDATISEIEAFGGPSLLPIRTTGLPASVDAMRANIRVALPTERAPVFGQTALLSNATGHTLDPLGSSPVLTSEPTEPIVRAFRSGGEPGATADPYNGYLPDDEPPRIVGAHPVELLDAPIQDASRPRIFTLPRLRFASTLCAHRPGVGDVLRQGGLVAEVLDDNAVVTGELVESLLVRLLALPSAWSGPEVWATVGGGAASFEAAFDPVNDAGREACFVSITPRGAGFPNDPTSGISTDALFRVGFSEAMDPTSLSSFDSLTLTRGVPFGSEPIASDRFVVGRVGHSADLRSFTFAPDLPLGHEEGSAESYFLTLATGAFAPRDLAGNDVLAPASIEATVDASAPTVRNGGRVSRFTSIDEEAPLGGGAAPLLPEWGGQILLDPGRQLIRPRPVVRSQAFIDRSQPALGGHTPFSSGIVTPLSSYGSKLQTVWRYSDAGLSLSDPTDANLDVEGLGWSPAVGTIVADSFAEFEIRLGHSRWLPDEAIDPSSLFPRYPSSGVSNTFADNPLPNSPFAVAHPREAGYVLDPADLFLAPSGASMMPFPMGRNVAPEERRLFTWRDTSLRERGGAQGGGADPDAARIALGLPPLPPNRKLYPPNDVPSMGLPLLMEFRTYRDPSAIGINGFDVNLTVNSSANPFFRVYSTGGVGSTGANVIVDPDNTPVGAGGINPSSTPAGMPTPSRDNTLYLGYLDLVVRVSRAHSVWFTAGIDGEPSFGGRTYRDPVVEPRAEDQPAGTELEIAFRGASSIEYLGAAPASWPGIPTPFLPWIDNDEGPPNPLGPNGTPLSDPEIDAFAIDLYGDYYNRTDAPLGDVRRRLVANPGIAFLANDDSWRSDVAGIADAAFYQVRVTFKANVVSGLAPELSAFAMTWTE